MVERRLLIPCIGCWTIDGEVTAREYTDPLLAPVHSPSIPTRRSIPARRLANPSIRPRPTAT